MSSIDGKGLSATFNGDNTVVAFGIVVRAATYCTVIKDSTTYCLDIAMTESLQIRRKAASKDVCIAPAWQTRGRAPSSHSGFHNAKVTMSISVSNCGDLSEKSQEQARSRLTPASLRSDIAHTALLGLC